MSISQHHSNEEGTVLTHIAYTVMEVAGRPPTGLEDVVGATTLTVARDGELYRVVGTGARDGDTVLFHQKEIGSATEDFLVWSIEETGDGDLVARPPLIG